MDWNFHIYCLRIVFRVFQSLLLFFVCFISKMDKLKRVLSGNDDTSNEENRGIMGDVGAIINTKKKKKQFSI